MKSSDGNLWENSAKHFSRGCGTMPVCRACHSQFPNRAMIDGKSRSLHTRKFCISCSPFGGHNTKTEKIQVRSFKCSCGETDPSKFYGWKVRVCGACHNQYTLNRGRETRNRILAHLGGKCAVCGFDKYPCSLEVHHLDPAIKDKTFAGMRGWAWQRVLKELKGCILLCRNCHAAVHCGYVSL